jgi:hypothetical protein
MYIVNSYIYCDIGKNSCFSSHHLTCAGSILKCESSKLIVVGYIITALTNSENNNQYQHSQNKQKNRKNIN